MDKIDDKRWSNHAVIDQIGTVVNIYNYKNKIILKEVYLDNIKLVYGVPEVVAYITRRGAGERGNLVKCTGLRIETLNLKPELRDTYIQQQMQRNGYCEEVL